MISHTRNSSTSAKSLHQPSRTSLGLEFPGHLLSLPSSLRGKSKQSQRGSALIYVLAVILIGAALSAGIVSMTTTSSFTGLSYNPSDQARYLAKSGLEYARSMIHSDPDNVEEFKEGVVFTVDNGQFELKYDDATKLITSIGRVFVGTSREASFEINGLAFTEEEQKMALVAKEDISLTGSSKISGNVRTVQGDIKLAWSTEIDGDLYIGATSTVDRPDNVTGDIIEDTSVDDFCKFQAPESANDCESLIISSDQTLGIDDTNCYQKIDIINNATLTVDVGNQDRLIVVNELNKNDSFKVGNIAINGNGRLIIYVENYFDMQSSSSYNTGGNANQLVVYYSGDIDITKSGNTSFKGAIFAPDAHVDILNSSVLRGYVEAKSFTGGASTGARLVGEYNKSFKDYCDSSDSLGPEIDFAAMTADDIQDFIENPLVKSYDHETEDRWDAGGGEYELGVTTDDVVLKNTNPWANLFIPIDLSDTCDEYIVRSVARLETSSTNEGGYAVFFDTRLGPANIPEQAYSFEFDRGFADGELIIRKDWQGARLKRYNDRNYLPVRTHDWWEDLHYVRLRITDNPGATDNRRVEASVYDLDVDYAYNMDDVFDFYFGPWNKRLSFSQSYDFYHNNEQIYIGLRGWHRSTYFHYLGTEMRCESPHHEDGLVLYVDGEGNTQEMPFNREISLPHPDYPGLTRLVITSSVGQKSIDNNNSGFYFEAPDGIYIESGVELSTSHNQQKIQLKSSNGDIVLEQGVKFSTDRNANNDIDEIFIEADGNIDIRGVEMKAQRFINLKAGGNIYAQNSNLEVGSKGQYGKGHEIILETNAGAIYSHGIEYSPDITYKCPGGGQGCVDNQ